METFKSWASYAFFPLIGALLAAIFWPNLQPAPHSPMDKMDKEGFTEAVAATVPSVVNVRNLRLRNNRRGTRLLQRFFPEQWPRQQNQSNKGSGVIISPKGYVLTNHHLVQRPEQISVELRDGSMVPAELIGVDPATDLAVLKIPLPDGEELPVMPVRSSEDLSVGEVVLAIGNPFGIGQTVTQGIVSALGRETSNPYLQMIQIDAAINPGNSGGALIDSTGNLLGIPTLLISNTGQWAGIGYVIPIEVALQVAEDIIRYGDVPRGWLGELAVRDLRPNVAKQLDLDSAVLVERLQLGAALELAGVQPGDLITRINDRPASSKLLRQYLNAVRPNERLTLQLWRDGELLGVEATTMPRPAGLPDFR